MSLQTPEPGFARRLVVLLDAKLEEVVTAFENADMHLTPPQLDGLLHDVVTKHLNKLERLSASAKSFAGFDASQAERDDRRAAWTYRLLHAQGVSATVRPAHENHMQADGMTSADIEAVEGHLTMLRSNKLVPTRSGIHICTSRRTNIDASKTASQSGMLFCILKSFGSDFCGMSQ
jgi:hypothetical protein